MEAGTKTIGVEKAGAMGTQKQNERGAVTVNRGACHLARSNPHGSVMNNVVTNRRDLKGGFFLYQGTNKMEHKTMRSQMWHLLVLITLTAFSLGLAACDGKAPPKTFNAQEARAEATFSVYKPVGQSLLSLFATTTITVEGEILGIDKNDPTHEVSATFSIDMDEASLSFLGDIPVNEIFPTGYYDVYLLLYNGVDYYGDIIENFAIIPNQLNVLKFQMDPMVGGNINIRDINSFFAYHIDIPQSVLSYSVPRMGLKVYQFHGDGSMSEMNEEYFNINAANVVSGTDIMLRQGTYKIVANFYDGAILRERTIGDDPVDLPLPDMSVVPNVEPLTATATVTNDGVALPHISFTIPREVVVQAGGLANLQTRLSLVGSTFELVEQSVVVSEVPGQNGEVSHYSASVDVPTFVTGEFAWALNFYDLRVGQIAYCAETAVMGADQNSATFICDLNLIMKDQAANFPVSTLSVQVVDGNFPGGIPGAVVTLNGQAVGIANSSTGSITAFVPAGTYTLCASHTAINPYDGAVLAREGLNCGQITLEAGVATTHSVELPKIGDNPTVVIVPAPGITDFPANGNLVLTFSQKMDPSTLDITLYPFHATTVSWSGDLMVATLIPTGDLTAGTLYTLKVNSSTADAQGLNLLGRNGTSFTVSPPPPPPVVTAMLPGNGSVAVPMSTQVSVHFDQSMDQQSVLSAFSLSGVDGFTYTFSGGDSIFTVVPNAELSQGTTYTACMSTLAKAINGVNLLQDACTSFTTDIVPPVPPAVVSVSPADGAMGVAIDTNITVTFDQAMDTASVESAFSIAPAVAGSKTWSPDGTSLTFNPAVDLEYLQTYTVSIGTGAMSAAGVALTNAVTGGFTTIEQPKAGQVGMQATRIFRPRQYIDASLPEGVTLPITVRIPPLGTGRDNVGVRVAEGLGNPDRFLLFLYLDDMKCMYLGGNYDRHIDGVEEAVFEDIFKSPVCNKGSLTAGDVVTVTQGMSARVITGDPHHPETTVEIVMDIVNP